MTDHRITRTMSRVPDAIVFEDEHGNPLPDWGEVPVDPVLKFLVAERSIRWKQSVDTVLTRFIHKALREACKP